MCSKFQEPRNTILEDLTRDPGKPKQSWKRSKLQYHISIIFFKNYYRSLVTKTVWALLDYWILMDPG